MSISVVQTASNYASGANVSSLTVTLQPTGGASSLVLLIYADCRSGSG
jgi:hypothetical protein